METLWDLLLSLQEESLALTLVNVGLFVFALLGIVLLICNFFVWRRDRN